MSRLPWINFVSPRLEQGKNRHYSKDSSVNNSCSGKEIAEFYNSLLSQPSENKDNRKDDQPNRSKPSSSTRLRRKPISKRKAEDIFKFAEYGDLLGVEECLSQGVDVNARDIHGWTALMCASCSGQKDVVELLLLNGANRRLADKARNNARKLALNRKHLHVVDSIDSFRKGLKIKREEKNNTKEPVTEEYMCSTCEVIVHCSKSKHECSILHNLNCNKISAKPVFQLPESNVGYQMMLRKGWDDRSGLGPSGTGHKYPVKTVLKQNRLGLGIESKVKPRVTHFKPFDVAAVQRKTQNSVCKPKPQNKKQRRNVERKLREFEINFRREFY